MKNKTNKTNKTKTQHTTNSPPPTNPSLTTPTTTAPHPQSHPQLTLLSPVPTKLLPTLSPLLTSLERKIFPSSSSTSFNYPLELKKPTIGVILAYYPSSSPSSTTTSSTSSISTTTTTIATTHPTTITAFTTLPSLPNTIGYLIFQRLKGTTWLHKLGIVEGERRKGVAKRMIEVMRERVRGGGGRKVVLWVEEGNGAMRLYEGEGWGVRERVEGYYGVGRAGVRMEMEV